MGAKQAGHRKYFFLYIACGIALFISESACRSVISTRPDEETAVAGTTAGHAPSAAGSLSLNTPAPTSADPLPAESTSKHLDAAYLALAKRNYTTAAWEIEMASIDVPPALRPETDYLSGLLYADPENPTGDSNKASETLRQIDKENLDPRRAGEIRVLTCLLNELQSMQNENERLLNENSQLFKKLVAEHNSVLRLKNLMKKMKEIDLGIATEE